MTARYNKATARARQAARYAALARPELARGDVAPRVFPAGATAAAIKTDDPNLRQLIDDALERRGREGGA